MHLNQDGRGWRLRHVGDWCSDMERLGTSRVARSHVTVPGAGADVSRFGPRHPGRALPARVLLHGIEG
jgi:hypothetical protein